MNIITFSAKPSPFHPVPMSKIPAEVAKQVVKDVRKNKKKEEPKK